MYFYDKIKRYCVLSLAKKQTNGHLFIYLYTHSFIYDMENVEDGNLTRRQKHRKVSRQHTLIIVKAILRQRFFLNSPYFF